jgi:hypothetical protein
MLVTASNAVLLRFIWTMTGAYRLYINGDMVAMGPGRTNVGVGDANNKVGCVNR